MAVLLCLIAGTLMAQEPKVTPLMSKDLTDFLLSPTEHWKHAR